MLLENSMPEEIDGIKIYADFRNMVRFSCALQDENLSLHEQIAVGLMQLYGTIPQKPEILAKRAENLLAFFLGPKRFYTKENTSENAKKISRAYDFKLDATLIYASFVEAYEIRLSQVGFMHWWEFLILLENLPSHTPMAKLMSVRTMDLSEIEDKKARLKLENLKRSFVLENKYSNTEQLTAKQREEQMKNRLKMRFEQAKKKEVI